MKRFVLMFMVAALAFIGYGSTEASAATTYTPFWGYFGTVGQDLRYGLSTSDGPGVVNVSLVQGTGKNGYPCYGCQARWTLELWRETSGYNTWTKIGTYTGYVDYHNPAHRTFKNIGTHNTRLKVILKIGNKTIVSAPWVR